MSIEGIDSTRVKLSRIHARTSKRQLEAFRKGAKAIHELAIDNAPIKTGSLERSITMAEPEVGNFVRKDIFIGVDSRKLGVGFSKYGFRYDQYLNENAFKLGKLSQEKRDSGKNVGPYFFQNAVNELEKGIAAELEKIAIEESLK